MDNSPFAQQHRHHRQSSLASSGDEHFLCLNELPRMPSASPPLSIRSRAPKSQSPPFLRLPTEIRLQIYGLLVLPRHASDLNVCREKVSWSTQDSFDYDKKQRGTDRAVTEGDDLRHPVLLIRTIDPPTHATLYPLSGTPHARTAYVVRCDRFRARCMTTTYHCVNTPRGIEDQLSILRTNKQIHAEAAGLLYSTYTFDFDTHVEAIVPFFSDLTPFARSCVKRIRVVKRALAYEKEFDRAEWSTAWRYLTAPSSQISLSSLSLGIVAGRPGENGWDRVPRYHASDYRLLKGMEGMEWMQYILEMQGLEDLDVHAVTEHCAPATNSMAMASFIRFSASVESGFRSFLRSELLRPPGATNAELL
ncbi:Hypothetical protein R9X50_00501800 [Acrodontium crateriforme]|uniref:Uncharacterized protein n=1 Tax=Acrodontium crateriforme TaxID=150365 RepID=A0AAQ3M6M2_9PEZI|nr:Hypothetical protein R9X50_00501800 [Acrodontium crateriforme]